jgi:uncharacterized protein (TIGR00299 family) protein
VQVTARPVLYLEPVGGIAGDMFLAAALDLGVNLSDLAAALAGLNLPGWRFEVSRQKRHEISGTHLDVVVDEAAAQHVHRPLPAIRALVAQAKSMPERARQRALAVFEALGEAEAKVHGVPVDQVEFHEVGAVDSLVDICGAAVVLELLGDPQVFAAPPPLGSGTARTAHGAMPIPPPATLELLKGLPVKFEGVGELTTPTGAALLKVLCQVGAPPELVITKVGYGVGTRDFRDRANVLRATLGQPAHAAALGTYVVEANLDDCSPQLLGALLEGLLEKGAVDAYVLPCTMKKSRPGHLLGAVVPADKRDAVIDVLLRESTTLGVRFHRVERAALDRKSETVETPYGPVRVKLGLRDGAVLNAQPEFEDCRALAAKAEVPVKQVWALALAGYYRR